MNEKLYGQHLASSKVLELIGSHVKSENPSKPLVLSFHGPVGVGKTYVSQTIAKYMYVDGVHSKFVHLISAVRDFPFERKVSVYKVRYERKYPFYKVKQEKVRKYNVRYDNYLMNTVSTLYIRHPFSPLSPRPCEYAGPIYLAKILSSACTIMKSKNQIDYLNTD